MLGSDTRRNRLLKSALALSLGGLLVAAIALALTISQYRDTNRDRNDFATVGTLSEAMVEMFRFQQALTSLRLGEGATLEVDVRNAYRSVKRAFDRLAQGPARAIFDDGFGPIGTVEELADAIGRLAPVLEHLDDPAAIAAAGQRFDALTPSIFSIVGTTNRRAATLNAQYADNLKLLQRSFVGVVVCIMVLAGYMIALLWRQNTLLGGAHVALSRLAGNLAETTTQLEEAHAALEGANAELTDQNRLLQHRESDARIQSARFAAALENMREGLTLFDSDGRLVVCNRRFAAMYGFKDPDPVPGTDVKVMIEHYVANGICDAEAGLHLSEFTLNGEAETVYLKLADGRFFEVHRQPLPEGGWVSTHEDITERRRTQAQLEFLARHDGLTGLPNRSSLTNFMANGLETIRSTGGCLGVISFDLDRFKQVNDLHGHAAGDELLREVARRALRVCGPRGLAARFGGDEFAIAVCPVEDESALRAMATRLIAELSEPYRVSGTMVEIGTSVGIAIAPDHGLDPQTLIRRADTALYEAKAAGRRLYSVFDFGMDQRLLERRALEADLKKALAQDKLELRYQPIVDIETQRIVAAEALLRWNHPDFGWVSPETFVPIAEESGLIVPLGEWVLRAACREAATWPTEISLSVNLSAAQLKSQGLVPTIVRALASTGLAARRLELEMTETVLFEENVALDVMNTLRTLGVRFSLDDFGTGYSSLSYLRRFRFDQIKIDKSFLRDGSDRPDGEAILHAIGGLGRTLGIETVAEGIETPAELAVVRAAGCVYGQGYLFGKPMPPQDLAARLLDQGTSELSTGPDGEIDAHGDLVMRPVREAIARAG